MQSSLNGTEGIRIIYLSCWQEENWSQSIFTVESRVKCLIDWVHWQHTSLLNWFFVFLMNIMFKESAGIYSPYSSSRILARFSTEQRILTAIWWLLKWTESLAIEYPQPQNLIRGIWTDTYREIQRGPEMTKMFFWFVRCNCLQWICMHFSKDLQQFSKLGKEQ